MWGLLFFLFVVGFIWDLVISFLGIIGLFGVIDWRVEYIFIYIIVFVGSFLILGLSINIEEIWLGFIKGNKIFILFYIVVIIFDVYIFFLGIV